MLGHFEGNPYPLIIILPPFKDPEIVFVDSVDLSLRPIELVYPTGSSRALTLYFPAYKEGTLNAIDVLETKVGTIIVFSLVKVL